MNVQKLIDQHPDSWFRFEQEQMKRIHRVYREAMREEVLTYYNDGTEPSSVNNAIVANTAEVQMVNNHEVRESTLSSASTAVSAAAAAGASSGQKDPEFFLPRDSPLRTDKGEYLKPANCPFKDFDTFVATTSIEYWKDRFTHEGHDRFLSETALALVSHICAAQSTKELRARHGSAPLGRYWRPKREHITPLALTMHELKEWAANRLRVANVAEESTYKEIARRIKYVQGLQRKEVWGPAAGPLHRGMRPLAHDKLFRLLLTTREDLTRAKEQAFRGWCRRRSREKLSRLGNLLKNVFFTEMRIISVLCSFDHNLSLDAAAPRLQPTDLLNSAANQSFVDYKTNVANVLLRALCEVPLVKSSLLSDYSLAGEGRGGGADGEDADDSLLETIRSWTASNLFALPGGTILEAEELPSFPRVYEKTVETIVEGLKKTGLKSYPIPPSAKTARAAVKKAFEGDETTTSAILSGVCKVLAALQDLVPAMYATHVFWGIAGDGGDFTVYDTLRTSVIQAMGDACARLYVLQAAERDLLRRLESCEREHTERMEQRRLKTRKSEYEPSWAGNVRYVQNELLPSSRRGFAEAFMQAQEIARDAWDYSLTKAGLERKVAYCQRVVADVVAGRDGRGAAVLPVGSDMRGEFSMARVVDLARADWLRVFEGGGGERTLPPAPTEASETLRFRREGENADREFQEIQRQNAREEEEEARRGEGETIAAARRGLRASLGGLGGNDLTEEEVAAIQKEAGTSGDLFAGD